MLVTLTANDWLGLAYLFVLWAVARATHQETSMLLAAVVAVNVANHPSAMIVVVVIGLVTYLFKFIK